MIAEFLYLLSLSAVGLVAMAPAASRLGVLLTAGVALPAGLGLTALSQLFLAIINFKLNAISLWILIAVELAAAIIWMSSAGHLKIAKLAAPATLAVLSLLLVSAMQAVFHAAVLSFDSYDYLVIASNLYRPETSLASEAITGFLNNYAPLLWLAHAPARLIGEEFLTLLHPVVFVCLLLTSSGLVEAYTRDARVSPTVRFFAILAPSVVMITTPQILHHAVYVMPNLLTALLYTASAGLLWAASDKSSARLLVPAAVCLAAVTLARQEGGLMSAILLALFATSDKVRWQDKTALAAFVAAISTIWYVALIASTGPIADQAILTPLGAMLQIGCLWVATTIAAASAKPALYRPIVLALCSAPLLLVLGHIAFFIIKPAHTVESVGVFFINLLWAPALWGIWWGVALVIGGLFLATRNTVPFGRFFGIAAVSVIVLVSLLGVVRWLPYRLGDQDSGNRMIMHVFPLLWAYFSIRFVWTQSSTVSDAK